MNYYVQKTYVWQPPPSSVPTRKDSLAFFRPQTHESSDYKNWIAQLDSRTCLVCRRNHGKIYEKDEFPVEPPLFITIADVKSKT